MALNPRIIQPVQIVDSTTPGRQAVVDVTGALKVTGGGGVTSSDSSGATTGTGTPIGSGTPLGTPALESGGNLQDLTIILAQVLCELRVQTMMLAQLMDINEDVEKLRDNVTMDLVENS